jgi:hypothetical protein
MKMSKTNKFKYTYTFAPAGTKILDLFDSEHFWSPGNPC